MGQKDKFLNHLKSQIEKYQSAYDSLKALPESVFELMEIPDVEKVAAPMTQGEKPTSFYGGGESTNVGILRNIISNAGENGISKSEILARFPKGDRTEQEHYNMVTNSMTQLKNQGEIEGFKPKTGKIKGYLWRIIE